MAKEKITVLREESFMSNKGNNRYLKILKKLKVTYKGISQLKRKNLLFIIIYC
jgi:hypothetical protein